MSYGTENNSVDLLLLELIRNNDEVAFRKLFNKYFRPLCRYSFSFVRNEEAAEEIVLDAFTVLWEHRDRLEISTSVRSYIFRSIRNRSFNYLRDTKNIERLEDHQDAVFIGDVHDFLEVEELDTALQEAILSLPHSCRDIFIASRSEGKTHREIAQDRNISVNTVETQISRALAKIRRSLKE